MFSYHDKNISKTIDKEVEVVDQLEEHFNMVLTRMQEIEEKNISLQKDMQELKVALECEKQYGRSKI